MKTTYIQILFLCICNLVYAQNIVTYTDGAEIVDKTIIIKREKNQLKSANPENPDSNISKLDAYLNSLSVTGYKQMYPNAKMPDCPQCVDISTIYKITYIEDIPVYKAINYLKTLPGVVYAEPLYIHYPLFVPNDPKLNNQYNLDSIDAYQAWDVTRGDSNIVIGIVDTEFDLNHEDLIDQVYYNFNDQIDGIDNDGDGYIDNFRGWDLADGDNNPNRTSTGGYHGSIVAGIACARTNNLTGIAGVGYYTKFLPVKIMSSQSGVLTAGFDGIVYAANHGCSVINCSWGSTYNNHLYAQDIIDYATFNRNALVVAAGGNNDNTSYVYPASLDNVISVSGTAVGDEKYVPENSGGNSGSNWNYKIDIAAPGASFLSTSYADGYVNCYGGTSFASPHVAAAAALLKSIQPNFSAIQLGEQLKVTANNIYNIPFNSKYTDLLGYGRLNVFNALTDTIYPSIYFENVAYKSSGDNIISGDTITMEGYFKNYLKAYNDIIIRLKSGSPYVNVLSEFFYIESIGNQDSVSNKALPFTFILYDNAPGDFTVDFKLEMEGDNYYSYQYFSLEVSQYSFDITVNDITTTVTSTGKLGINDNITGKKIIYKDFPELLYDGGLFYGNSNVLNPQIASCFRGTNDFKLTRKPVMVANDSFDVKTFTTFNDENALDRSYGFEIEQSICGKENDSLNFIIYKNDIINKSEKDYSNLYFGVYADIDLLNAAYNVCKYDENSGMLYAYNVQTNNLYMGLLVLSENSYSHYAIDNSLGNTVYLNDGFSELEKQISLINERASAGTTSIEGNDIAAVVSAYEEFVNSNDTVEFTFAILAAQSEEKLMQCAYAAKDVYTSIINPKQLTPIPGPENLFTIFPTKLAGGESITIKTNESIENIRIADILGRNMTIDIESSRGTYQVSTTGLLSGVYNITFIVADTQYTQKIVIE